MKNLFDGHNHCQFSFDGKKTTVELSSKAAIERGLGGIVFTDHCDLFVPQECIDQEGEHPQNFDIAGQQAEIDRVQALIGDQIRILKGIEIGIHERTHEQVKDILNNYSFDQVIASAHYIADTDPYYGGFFVGKDWKQAYRTLLGMYYFGAAWLRVYPYIPFWEILSQGSHGAQTFERNERKKRNH